MGEARLKLYQGKTHTKPIVEDPSEQAAAAAAGQGQGLVACLRRCMCIVHVEDPSEQAAAAAAAGLRLGLGLALLPVYVHVGGHPSQPRHAAKLRPPL